MHESADYLCRMLRVGWEDAISVARNEKELSKAQAEHQPHAVH